MDLATISRWKSKRIFLSEWDQKGSTDPVKGMKKDKGKLHMSPVNSPKSEWLDTWILRHDLQQTSVTVLE